MFNDFVRNAAAAAIAAVIATGCLAAAAAPAAAAEAPVNSRAVSYGDLNLNTAKGRAALDARIRAAARQVCEAPGADIGARVAADRCFKTAVRAATIS